MNRGIGGLLVINIAIVTIWSNKLFVYLNFSCYNNDTLKKLERWKFLFEKILCVCRLLVAAFSVAKLSFVHRSILLSEKLYLTRSKGFFVVQLSSWKIWVWVISHFQRFSKTIYVWNIQKALNILVKSSLFSKKVIFSLIIRGCVHTLWTPPAPRLITFIGWTKFERSNFFT